MRLGIKTLLTIATAVPLKLLVPIHMCRELSFIVSVIFTFTTGIFDNNLSSDFGFGLEYEWSSLTCISLNSVFSSLESCGNVESGVHLCLGQGEFAYNYVKVTTYKLSTLKNISYKQILHIHYYIQSNLLMGQDNIFS